MTVVFRENKLWAWFKKKKLLHYFVVYAAINFCLILGYSFYEQITNQGVQLKPVLPTETDWNMIGLSVAILPFSLLFEELGFRFAPKRILTVLKVPIDKGLGFVTYLVISGIFAALTHQLNVVSADPLSRLLYFGIQLFSGLFFAYYYLRHGFWAIWILHTGWDLLLVSITILSYLL